MFRDKEDQGKIEDKRKMKIRKKVQERLRKLNRQDQGVGDLGEVWVNYTAKNNQQTSQMLLHAIMRFQHRN